MDMYKIWGVVEKRRESEGVLVNISVNGTSKIFQKSIKEIHTKEWLEKFSPEDVAYIGFLAAAEYNGDSQLINVFPRRKSSITNSVVFLGMLFVCFLLMSNLTGLKIGAISVPFLNSTVEFTSALIFFPVTYLFSNVLTEVYGYKVARMVIWGGFICSVVVLIGFWATVHIPASDSWLNSAGNPHESYERFFNSYARAFLASSLAYFLGEFLNSVVLAKLKILSAGKYLYVRVVSSTFAGQSVDSVIYCFIAFYGMLSGLSIVSIVVTQIVIKVTYEIVMLPVTYRIVTFLKNKDGVDYYDTETKFNPFSLKTEDEIKCRNQFNEEH